MITRRDLLKTGAVALAAGLEPARPARAGREGGEGSLPAGYRPVITPDVGRLPWRWEGGAKAFHLVAEPVKREIAPGLVINAWGYNGSTPGPTIEVVQGDRVRLYVTNRLPERTSVHWHGIILPNGMDGASGLTQKAIDPGDTYLYEFTLDEPGTQMYHPHFDEMVQMGMGMMGFFIVHPRPGSEPPVERDYALFLHEWFVRPGTATPDPSVMTEFNLFTFNGRAFPGTSHLWGAKGERLRLRIANVSMDSHPIHLHGVRFKVTATDGGRIPPSAQWPETTVNVPPGTTRDIEMTLTEPGDWPLHCHKTHHTMNQMGHGVPNPIGVDSSGADATLRRLLPGYMPMGRAGMGDMHEMPLPPNTLPMGSGPGPFHRIEMGGMFTILKVRERLAGEGDPGWYAHPRGTVASPVKPPAWTGVSAPPARPQIWTCPMHPHVEAGGAGVCPECGMALMPRPQ